MSVFPTIRRATLNHKLHRLQFYFTKKYVECMNEQLDTLIPICVPR